MGYLYIGIYTTIVNYMWFCMVFTDVENIQY